MDKVKIEIIDNENKNHSNTVSQLYCEKSTMGGKQYYFGYATISYEIPPCNCHYKCGNCYEEVGYLDLFYEHVSDDIDTAICKFLDITEETNTCCVKMLGIQDIVEDEFYNLVGLTTEEINQIKNPSPK